MTDELSNSTIELVRDWIADIINDREAWRDGRVAKVLAPEFVRHDRRKVIAQPPADAAEYIASVVELERLTGEFPIYVMQEPVSVRGQRLCAVRWIGRLGADEMSMIIVIQADDTVGRLEQVILFDPEDSDDALAELDRLYAELGEN
jgi:hypothetical protein